MNPRRIGRNVRKIIAVPLARAGDPSRVAGRALEGLVEAEVRPRALVAPREVESDGTQRGGDANADAVAELRCQRAVLRSVDGAIAGAPLAAVGVADIHEPDQLDVIRVIGAAEAVPVLQ